LEKCTSKIKTAPVKKRAPLDLDLTQTFHGSTFGVRPYIFIVGSGSGRNLVFMWRHIPTYSSQVQIVFSLPDCKGGGKFIALFATALEQGKACCCNCYCCKCGCMLAYLQLKSQLQWCKLS